MPDTAAPTQPDMAALLQPGSSAAAPATAPAAAPAAPVSTPAPTQGQPNIGGLAQPGSVAAEQNLSQQYAQRADQVASQPLQVAPVPGQINPNAPHARLLSMIQGLAVGMDSFATAAATRGEKGGVEEVQQYNAQKQAMQQSAQRAAQEQRNEQLNQNITMAHVHMEQMQTAINVQKAPYEIQQMAADTQAKMIETFKAAGVPMQFIPLLMGQDFGDHVQGVGQIAAQNGGLNKNVIAHDGTQSVLSPVDKLRQTIIDPGNPDLANAASSALASEKVQLQGIANQLGKDDPNYSMVEQSLSQLDMLAKNGGKGMNLWDFSNAINQLNVLPTQALGQKQHILETQKAEAEATTAKETAAASSPFGKLSTPEALAAPGAQAAIQAKIDDPSTSPEDILRLRPLLAQAKVAQWNAENIKNREALAQQLITQGNPDDAGKLLADRSLTIEELKSRQVTSQFIEQAILSAQKYDPTYKAAEASAQARIAGSPANQQFFGNTNTILEAGGTLDQLQTRVNDLPNGRIPAFNKVTNLVSQSFGATPTAAYAAAVLGVADDYAKVMGIGTDTAREQVMERLDRTQSPEQATAVINQFRQQIASQREGRIGKNPYIRDMYPDPAISRGGDNTAATGDDFVNKFGH